MKKTIRKKRKKFAWTSFYLFCLLFFAGSVLLGGWTLFVMQKNSMVSSDNTFAYDSNIFCPSPANGKDGLQLKACYPRPKPSSLPDIPMVVSMPTPIQSIPLNPNPQSPETCGISTGLLNGAILKKGTTANGTCCVEDGPSNNSSECCPGVMSNAVTAQALGYPVWCDAKPVIYLYPKKRTTVSVAIIVPGTIPVSDPLYPVGGWKGIDAFPDGTFIYKNHSYKELFYEAAIKPVAPPTTGTIVSLAQLQPTLQRMTNQLGLTASEQQEFLAYWLAKLKNLKSNYLLISVFSPEQKEIIDHVDITPKPDTFIAFIMYFKPVNKPFALPDLVIPTPPQRNGFTAVEWGGIVDR